MLASMSGMVLWFFFSVIALIAIYHLMASGMKTVKNGVMRLKNRENAGGVFLLAGVTILVVALFLMWHVLKYVVSLLKSNAGY